MKHISNWWIIWLGVEGEDEFPHTQVMVHGVIYHHGRDPAGVLVEVGVGIG